MEFHLGAYWGITKLVELRVESIPLTNVRRPSVLIATAKWWPLSARLASAFVKHGCTVSALCPAGHPMAKVSGVERVIRYAGVDSLSSLRSALTIACPDFIVPCDDGVVAQLHSLHSSEPSCRTAIENSLGSPAGYPIVCSRERLLEAASQLGIAVAQTRRVLGPEDLVHWHRHAPVSVVKVDGESGGNGVRICGSTEEALAAWRDLSKPLDAMTGWKRLFIDRDPIAIWRSGSRAAREITVQQMIRGRPANCMVACRNGKLISIVSVAVLAADGPTGAAVIIQRIRNEPMEKAALLLAEKLKLTGFFGLDFMIAADTKVPYLIEMNPRSTQLGHLEFADQGSLVGAFSAHWCGKPATPAENPISARSIALFPQALNAAVSRHHDSSYLDVPWDEPALQAELKLPLWPQRQWAARLYHAFRPIGRTTAVEYDTPNDTNATATRVAPTRADVAVR
jgi:hypothetical protein